MVSEQLHLGTSRIPTGLQTETKQLPLRIVCITANAFGSTVVDKVAASATKQLAKVE
jgi:hypothetical protein